MKNKILIGIVAAIVIIGVGYYFFHSNSPQVNATQSPVNTVFNSAKIAEIVFNPSTGSATSTSILNTDSNDRYIISNFAGCGVVGTSLTAYTGAGLSTLTFKFATTSDSAPAIVSNTNVVTLTIATATPDFLINTASTGGTSSFLTRWASGSYLTIFSNATNTAQCSAGVYYIAS